MLGRWSNGFRRRIRDIKVNLFGGLGEQYVGSVGSNGSDATTTTLAARRSNMVGLVAITVRVVVTE
jgi:hypothetical protein